MHQWRTARSWPPSRRLMEAALPALPRRKESKERGKEVEEEEKVVLRNVVKEKEMIKKKDEEQGRMKEVIDEEKETKGKQEKKEVLYDKNYDDNEEKEDEKKKKGEEEEEANKEKEEERKMKVEKQEEEKKQKEEKQKHKKKKDKKEDEKHEEGKNIKKEVNDSMNKEEEEDEEAHMSSHFEAPKKRKRKLLISKKKGEHPLSLDILKSFTKWWEEAKVRRMKAAAKEGVSLGRQERVGIQILREEEAEEQSNILVTAAADMQKAEVVWRWGGDMAGSANTCSVETNMSCQVNTKTKQTKDASTTPEEVVDGNQSDDAHPVHSQDEHGTGGEEEEEKEEEEACCEAPGTAVKKRTVLGHPHQRSLTPTLKCLLQVVVTSQLSLARLWVRYNLRPRAGLAVRVGSGTYGLRRLTQGLVKEDAVRHAMTIEFPQVNIEHLPDHLPGRRRLTNYYCHIGPRLRSPHLKQLLQHTCRLSCLEEVLLALPCDGHRWACLFCRAALLYTGCLHHQVSVTRLYQRYTALERHAGRPPLSRSMFLRSLTVTFPAAFLPPATAGRSSLVVGMQLAQTPIWDTHTAPT